jgi:DNA-binding MarR family transcriptional regulator
MDKVVINELKEFGDILKKKVNFFEGTKVCVDNMTQAQVVCFIGEHQDEEISQRDIEKFLNCSKSSVSSLLDTLEKKDVIIREVSKSDARKNIIKLSNDTIESIKHVEDNIISINKTIINNIDSDKLNTFYEVLDLMKDNIRKEDNND